MSTPVKLLGSRREFGGDGVTRSAGNGDVRGAAVPSGITRAGLRGTAITTVGIVFDWGGTCPYSGELFLGVFGR